MQTFLIAGPEDFREASRFGVPLAHAAYRIGPGSTLLRQNLPLQARGGLLLVGDREAPAVTEPEAVCAAAIRECSRRDYGGVVLDFEGPPRPDLLALARCLGPRLAERGLGLYLPEPYGEAAPEARILMGTALSGGHYRERLTEAAQRWGGYSRLALDAERLRMDFPLPCPAGIGTPLTAEEFQALSGRQSFFSPELCARYFTCLREGRHHFVLYDDAATLREKLRIAAELGVGAAFFSWPEVADMAEELFSAPLS